MTGKQLILDALENKITKRTPYVPFVGVHAAALIGMGAQEYLKSADNIIAVSEMVRDEYQQQVAMELIGTGTALSSDLDLSEYGGSKKCLPSVSMAR